MARRTTDLLDVFRAEKPPTGRPASASEPAGGPKRPFEGLFFAPRQLLLGSCVVVLLLVFTFVLGLSVGRRGASGGSNALQANAPRVTRSQERAWYVVARVPYADAARQVRIEPASLRDKLVEHYGVPEENIWVIDDPDARQWRVAIGPFTNQKQGIEFLQGHTMLMAKLGSVTPFQNPIYLNLRPQDLPERRLP